MTKICIIDYKMGNLFSIKRGLQRANAEVDIIEEPTNKFDYDGLVIPGVGAFKIAIKNILPFKSAIEDFISSGRPILGICLGLQIFFTKSYEGGEFNGLNFIEGEVVRFPDIPEPVPHMGWNIHISILFILILESQKMKIILSQLQIMSSIFHQSFKKITSILSNFIPRNLVLPD